MVLGIRDIRQRQETRNMGKLDWSGICATSKGRHQCCEENCILFEICLIKDASRLTRNQTKGGKNGM